MYSSFFYRWVIERLGEQKYRETYNKDPRCIFIKHWNSKGTSLPEMEECQCTFMYIMSVHVLNYSKFMHY